MICLSFDTDHMDDARMGEFVAEFALLGAATFFCTERYTTIPEGHEVGAHVILEWGSDWEHALDEAAESFPDARGFRSHGCLWSHGLTVELANRGYRYISAHDQPGRPDIAPHREAWGLWHLPIYYMDTLDISYGRHWPGSQHQPFSVDLLATAIGGDGVYVFAFHPIHLLLNTSTPEEYLEARDEFRAGASLDTLRSDDYGAGDYYRELTGMMDEAGVRSESLNAVVSARAESAGA